MLTVYLCDDNKSILDKYKNLLLRIADSYHLTLNILTFLSGEQLLFHIEDIDILPDIIYLDILMGGDNGLQTAKKLRDMGCRAEIIFLTANPEFVFDSFDTSPTHYILKDTVTEERFRDIFFKTANLAAAKSKDLFYCENSSVKKQIPISSISHFEIKNRIVTVYFDKTSFDFYARMEDVESKLNSKVFVRTHRSFLVNLRFVDLLHKNTLQLTTGEIIPVGVTYTKIVKASLSRYLNLIK